MRQPLFNRSDAAGIFTPDDIFDLFGEGKRPFLYNFTVFDDIDGNGMVDKAENVKIEHINIAFHFQNIFPFHFIAAGVFDNRHRTVQFIELQMVIDGHAFSRFDMVEYKAFFDFSHV